MYVQKFFAFKVWLLHYLCLEFSWMVSDEIFHLEVQSLASQFSKNSRIDLLLSYTGDPPYDATKFQKSFASLSCWKL